MATATAAFDCTVRSAHDSLRATCDPQRYELPQPVCRHLSAVDNGLSHMKLDNHFLANSQLWRQQVPCSEVRQYQESSTEALQRGQSFLQDYRSAMCKEFASTLTDSQATANRAAALDGLCNFRREFDPNACVAHDRVQRFCDWVGVTDRFTGYRSNLTRGSREPLCFDPQWRRGECTDQLPRLCHPKFVPESIHTGAAQRFNLRQKSAPLVSRRFCGGDAAACDAPDAAGCDLRSQQCAETARERTPQELAGIETKFPGSTEYKDRFLRPKTARTTFDYTINPHPDFSVVGRPLCKAQPEPRITEYGDRYIWPDSKNLQPTPWKRTC